MSNGQGCRVEMLCPGWSLQWLLGFLSILSLQLNENDIAGQVWEAHLCTCPPTVWCGVHGKLGVYKEMTVLQSMLDSSFLAANLALRDPGSQNTIEGSQSEDLIKCKWSASQTCAADSLCPCTVLGSGVRESLRHSPCSREIYLLWGRVA